MGKTFRFDPYDNFQTFRKNRGNERRKSREVLRDYERRERLKEKHVQFEESEDNTNT